MTPQEKRENKRLLSLEPSAKHLFKTKLEELNTEQQEIDERKQHLRDYAMTLTDEDTYQLVTRYATTYFAAEELRIKKQRAKWARLLNPPSDAQRAEFDLPVLKLKVPIAELIETKPKTSTDARITFPCPFHTEKTASFTVFKNDNTFHCFGCQAHGDLITFIMKTENLDFFRACKYIDGL